ncbi:MAG: hypothetical protein KatS3mg083_526 [Candidatus Dojkabacteria bacterium]|nr:MAG: hypothetical protein KatS3mg083_526 [Candidatus Dojkabacteria bacterium]
MGMCCCGDHSILENLLREIRDRLNDMWGTWTGIFTTIRDTLLNLFNLLNSWINSRDGDVWATSAYATFSTPNDPSVDLILTCSCNPALDYLREITIQNMLPDTARIIIANPEPFDDPDSEFQASCSDVVLYVPPYGTLSLDTRGNMRLPIERIGDRELRLRVSTLGEGGMPYAHPNNKVYVTAVWYSK